MDMPTMDNFWIDFPVAALATWRISHLLVNEDGPWRFVPRIRARVAGSELGRVLDCFGCASLWVALPAALFVSRHPLETVATWFALSGAAFLLERFSGEPLIIERITENRGVTDDDLLRTETDTTAGRTGNAGHGDQSNA
jgi:hypothetical protein